MDRESGRKGEEGSPGLLPPYPVVHSSGLDLRTGTVIERYTGSIRVEEGPGGKGVVSRV